jgi:hypothetical protein
MNWRSWLRRKPPKPPAEGDVGGKPRAPRDTHAPLRELLFADESLECVARFVLQQEALGAGVGSLWRRLANVAAWVAQEHRERAIEELHRLLEDKGQDARSCFQFWNYLRQLGQPPAPEVAVRVLGFVIEHARRGSPEILSAYWDGSARLLDVRGDFSAFTHPSPVMVAHVRRCLRVCQPLVDATRPANGPRPAPPDGTRCRITVLTPAGLRAREGDWEALWADEVCGPVLEMAEELSQRLMEDAVEKGLWRSDVAPWPGRGGASGEGGPLVH